MSSVRCYLFFSKTGGAAFLSHLDTLRIFDRAARRSGLDLRFTSGFNPHVRLSAGTALPVGLSSCGERFTLMLNREYDRQEVIDAVGRELPSGFSLNDVAFDATLEEEPEELRFAIRYNGERDQAARAVAGWREQGVVDVTRNEVKGRRRLDLDDCVQEVSVSDSEIRISIRPGSGAMPRMSDLYRAFLLIPDCGEAGIDLLDIVRL